MRSRPPRRFSGSRSIAFAVAALAVVLTAAPAAHAGRGRPSGAQRAAMQRMQKQQQAYVRDAQRYQQDVAAKQAEIAKQYDTNGDGKLTGAEKSKYDKYMYDVQQGRQPNPFAGILPPGKGSEMSSAKK